AFLAQGTLLSLAMGTMTGIYAAALAFLARDFNRSLMRNFRQQVEFQSLTAGLEQEIRRRESAERELSHLARHDTLTGLPNRATFFERLRLEIGRAKRGETRFAVHYVDLDDFKKVNDSYGHHVGDRLLVAIATELVQSVRQVDLVARLGGDEFAVVQAGISVPAQAESLAAKLIERIEKPCPIEGSSIGVTASIGIALYGPDVADADAIVERADIAMYTAKAEGRRRYRLYDADCVAPAVRER
ncbi:MAG: diguanylate cyclase domain-containing protein, partial [Solirubrobacterales bacterium]